MKNKTYIWISVAILGVGGYFIYKNLLKKPTRTKQENIDIIVNAGMSKNSNNLLNTFRHLKYLLMCYLRFYQLLGKKPY